MATISQVALEAQVSPTTVSRYLNNRIELPAATKARIDAAIKRLDYRPNLLAKRLSTGKTELICVVAPEIANPFFTNLVAAIEDEAEQHGYSVLLSSTRGMRTRELELISRLEDRHVDGVILMTNQPDDGHFLQVINKTPNVVLLDENIPGFAGPSILVENVEGAYQAARHLIAAGHTRIGHIGGPPGLMSTIERQEGFLRALNESGLEPSHILLGAYTREFGQTAIEEIIRDGSQRPTAIFAGSDYVALGVMQRLAAHGIDVPTDMSIIGFDDMPFADMLAPPLTTIRQPVQELGRRAFLTLLASLNGEPAHGQERLATTLVERQSVASIKCERTGAGTGHPASHPSSNESTMSQKKHRVLIAGESWTVHSIHQKGFDTFTTTEYSEGIDALRNALELGGWQVDYQPSHVAARAFPFTKEDLAAYDCVMLSDIGANTLLLHPDTFARGKILPNRLAAIRDYVAAGGGFVMVGGYLTFQGIDAKAQYCNSPIEEILPVNLMATDDRAEHPQGVAPRVEMPAHPIVSGLETTWPSLLGYNRLRMKQSGDLVASVGPDPLIACGSFGSGRAVAFSSDCAPHWAPEAFVSWRDYNTLWQRIVSWSAGLI